MRRTLLVLSLAALGAVAPSGLAGAAPTGGVVDLASAETTSGEDYICIRSHILLGEDNPICIHVSPFGDRQG